MLGLLGAMAGQLRAEPEPCDSGLLPSGRPFRPLLADVKEPRFSAAYHLLDFQDGPGTPGGGREEIEAGLLSMGGTLGLWRTPFGTGPCEGIQINAAGGAFSQFDLDAPSEDLINTDFTVGIPVTFRFGRLSGRVQLYHQSSHLGDEFVLNNPGVDRRDLNIEWVDGLLSLEGEVWRIYAGGGYWFSSAPDDLDIDPLTAQYGLELKSGEHPWWAGSSLRGVAGVDVQMLETHDWDPTSSVRAGLELGRGRTRVRLLGVYLHGPLPFGQFFLNEDFESYGIEVQVDL